MQLKVITKDGSKHLKDLQVGELILCEGGQYLPVKSIMVISGNPILIRTSDNSQFHVTKRMVLKTDKGFKYPELWDTLIINQDITPMIVHLKIVDRIEFFYDILVDGNIVTPHGVIFRYSE
jgi:hypothetical protein